MRRVWCVCVLVLLAACGPATTIVPTAAPTIQPLSSPVLATAMPTAQATLLAPTPTETTPIDPSPTLAAPTPEASGVERILYTADTGDVSRLFAVMPDGTERVALSPPNVDVSEWAVGPDQKQIAFVVNQGETSDIMLAAVNSSTATTIVRNLPNAWLLTWSPDGTRIAFVVAPDGFANGANEDIYVVNTDGSNAMQLTSDPLPEISPVWSPDSSMIAFERGNYAPSADENPQRLFVMQADGQQQRLVAPDLTLVQSPRWTNDSKQLVVLGYSATSGVRSGGMFTYNADGSNIAGTSSSFAFQPGMPAVYSYGNAYGIDFSPDGKHVAFMRQDGECQVEFCTRHIFVENSDGSEQRQVTTGTQTVDGDSLLNGMLAWSPDNTQLLFSSNREGDYGVYLINADGSGLRRLVGDEFSFGAVQWRHLAVAPMAPTP